MTRSNYIPKLCQHKSSGLAYVRLDGKDHYLGPYGTVDAESAYHRLIAEYLAASRTGYGVNGTTCQSIAELCDAYHSHAVSYYRKNGRPTSEIHAVRSAIRVLLDLYASYPPDAFTALQMKACRQVMIADGLARGTINQRVGRIKRIFAWAGENELVDSLIYHRLACVKGLQPGRGGRETEPRQPAIWRDVLAVRPHVVDQVWAMINLQWLTGMRSQNVVEMRTVDLDMTAGVWFYAPQTDKVAHRRKGGRRLVIAIGPKAQDVLRPWLRRDLTAYLFQPVEAVATQRARMIADRKARNGTGSHKPRVRRPRRKPGSRYTPVTYGRAVRRACNAAGILRWSPHQLRHAFATRAGDTFDGHLDKVAAALGHANVDVTRLYAHLNRRKAADVARKIG